MIPTLPNIDTGDLGLSSLAFLPELLLCVGIVLMLFLRLNRGFARNHMGGVALAFVLLALINSVMQFPGTLDLVKKMPGAPAQPGGGGEPPAAPAEKPPQWVAETRAFLVSVLEGVQGTKFGTAVFSNLLFYDGITIYLRCFLYTFTALLIWLTLTTGIPDAEDSADFYTLLLGATVGMVLMASASHLLMLFIGVEMASLPCYALAGYLKGKRQGSEAALKYVVYGGGAAGVMLFGISLLAGRFGTGYLPDLAVGFARSLSPLEGGPNYDPVLIFGALFLLVGVAFKVAAVPFHFWCPDVFEGASAEVAGYLSVASKGAALVMLARVAYCLGGVDESVQPPGGARWMGVAELLMPALAVLAALTATFGNLAAYVQTNLKRLLAYSTIAHAGYMMMAVATLTRPGLEAMLFYLAAYLFMNLGAFAVVAYLRNETGSEDLDDYRGLVRRSPWMVVTLSFFLLSLLGVPPLIGFMAKFEVFQALYQAGDNYSVIAQKLPEARILGPTLYALLAIGAVNTVISAVYYVKVMKVMILDRRAEDLEGREPVRLLEPRRAVTFTLVLTLAVIVLGLVWGPVDAASHAGGKRMTATVNTYLGGKALPAPVGLK
jgi:NADH-quinone oxidoreductase subunit N